MDLANYLRVKDVMERNNVGSLIDWETEHTNNYSDKDEGNEDEISETSKGCAVVAIGSKKIPDCSSLKFKLHQLESSTPLAIGGFDSRPIECYLEMQRSNDESGSFINVGKISSLDMKSLLPFCNPSPFGDLDNQETRVDRPYCTLGNGMPSGEIETHQEAQA